MARLFRSLLFVPGNNPRFVEKARSAGADATCYDLEDSVPAAEKGRARRAVASELEGGLAPPNAFVRTNSPASGMIPDDLRAAARAGLSGVVVPKVDGAEQLLEAEGLLSGLEAERGLPAADLAPSIESALGAVNCHSIASCSRRVCAVVFGVFDLLNDMGIEYERDAPGARHARAKIPLDAAAAGVAAIDGVWDDVRDAGGLEADCIAGRRLGYAGKSIIHPSQIPAAHAAFRPTAAEAARAARVRDAYLAAAEGGRGATTVDGRMIDEVHYRRALAVLGAAGGRADAGAVRT